MYKLLLVGSLFFASAFAVCQEPSVEVANQTLTRHYGELLYSTGPGGLVYVSSVAIISNWFALTSANSVIDYGRGSKAYHIRVIGDAVFVKDVHIQPMYKHYSKQYDIAIIEFDSELIFNDRVQPIPLLDFEPPIGSKVYALGKYDGSLSAEVMNLEVVNPLECNAAIGVPVFDICGKVTCDEEDKGFYCRNSIGGPLIYDGKLAGITSQPDYRCGKLDHPTIFTNIVDSLVFINNIINKQ